MKTILLSAALLLCGISPALGEVVTKGGTVALVRNNPGGDTTEFDVQARVWSKAKTQVRIQGACMSACTMYVMTKYHLDVCAVEGATLKFHMPYYLLASGNSWVQERGPKAVQNNKREWNRDWLGKFSPKLNAVLSDATRKGIIPNPATETEGSKFYTVKATDFIKTCD